MLRFQPPPRFELKIKRGRPRDRDAEMNRTDIDAMFSPTRRFADVRW